MNDSRSELGLWREASEIFDELLELPPGERRATLEARDLDPEIALRVRRLLEADLETGVLDRPAPDLLPPDDVLDRDDPPKALLAGRRIGPFEIVEEIGRGGMAVVFRASRRDGGFDQEVALKLLTVGSVASGERVRREKEVLARLRHPHIATLIDGGVEPDGTPWLAMTLVDGSPIDTWCEDRQLGAREIVTLVLDVCEAVAYAHRNLVVHRDLKPGNVLVDDQGHVRLLDFGIAKLLDEAESERTQTRAFTPRYAAPEQLAGEPVTTATDVFGLGGLLLRLLTGETPRPRDSDSSRTGDQNLQVVRPSRAPNAVTGIDRDLDRVVLEALRAEPERRYASAADLAEDLRRWLDRRPVHAVPDSWLYRLRKLVQRRRGAVLATLALTSAIVLGVVSTAWQAARATEQAEVAAREARRASAVTEFLLDLFEFAEPDRSQGETLTVRQALDAGTRRLEARLDDQAEVKVELLGAVGEIYRRLGLYDEAEPLLERAVALAESVGGNPRLRSRLRRSTLHLQKFELEEAEEMASEAVGASVPKLRSRGLEAMGAVRRAQGRFAEADEHLRLAQEIEEAESPPDLEQLAGLRLARADTAFEAGNLDAAERLYEDALDLSRRAHEGDHTQVALILQSLGVHAAEIGHPAEAQEHLEEALAIRERLLGETHPDVAFTLGHLAQLHRTSGRLDDAEALYRRALELQREALGDGHPAVLSTLNSLAILAYDRGDPEQAAERLSEVVERGRETFGEDHPTLAEFLVNLAAIRRVLGDHDRAEAELREAIAIHDRRLRPDSLAVGHTWSHLGNLERSRGRLELAVEHYRRALDAIRSATSDDHPETLAVRANLAGVAFEREDWETAAAEFEQAFRVATASMEEGHPVRTLIQARTARSLVRVGRAEEAVELAEDAAETAASLYEPNHGRRLEIDAILGATWIAAGREELGRERLRAVRERLDAGASSSAAEEILDRWDVPGVRAPT